MLMDFSRGNKSLIMKISIVHYENLDCSWWKSRPYIMKISTVQHDNLDRSTWKSGPFNMKNWTIHQEYLDRLSWKSRSFFMKISTVCKKVLTVCRKNKSQLLTVLFTLTNRSCLNDIFISSPSELVFLENLMAAVKSSRILLQDFY